MVPPVYSTDFYFNPRSPYGERPALKRPCTGAVNFNPRSPYGERHADDIFPGRKHRFQSTLPLRGATVPYAANSSIASISIHAPLTGSDQYKIIVIERFDISIHAPLTGSDKPPQGIPDDRYISIHAPLTGSDRQTAARLLPGHDFNPRSPYGERPMFLALYFLAPNFNPRSPYGERRWRAGEPLYLSGFQSTLPLRGATGADAFDEFFQGISIHAPLTGSDPVR